MAAFTMVVVFTGFGAAFGRSGNDTTPDPLVISNDDEVVYLYDVVSVDELGIRRGDVELGGVRHRRSFTVDVACQASWMEFTWNPSRPGHRYRLHATLVVPDGSAGDVVDYEVNIGGETVERGQVGKQGRDVDIVVPVPAGVKVRIGGDSQNLPGCPDSRLGIVDPYLEKVDQ